MSTPADAERSSRDDRLEDLSAQVAELRAQMSSAHLEVSHLSATLTEFVGDLRDYDDDDRAVLLAETQRLRLAGNFIRLTDRHSIDGALVVDGRVSIIIVTYGTDEIVERCLAAVAEHTDHDHEVIVVDNPPDDGRERTAVRLRHRSDLQLIEPETNLGFGGANNLGVHHATGDLLCFMNPDVIVTDDWLAPLIAALDAPAVAVAAPVLLNADGSLQEAGQRLCSDGSTLPLTRATKARADYASAALWLVRRSDHLGLGGFDQRYHPAYCEDVDYALRARAGGAGVVVVPTTPVIHVRGRGGAGGDVVMAQRSQTYLKARWAVELRDQPPPPRPRFEWWMLGAIGLIAIVGMAARVLVLRSFAGGLNADEAYTGVESFEVLAGRFPIVLGGTAYTAVLEAYLYAPVVVVFGASITTLKIIPILFWFLASAITARAAYELVRAGGRGAQPQHSAHRRWSAAVSAFAIMWITPGALMELSTRAYASYASGMMVLAVTLLLAVRLVDDDEPRPMSAIAVGVLAGVGFWMHPMYLSSLVPIVAIVMLAHRRRPRRRIVWPSVIVGGLIGSAPYLLWNLRNAFISRRLPAQFEGTYFERLSVFWRELLPRAFGLRDTSMQWYLGPVIGIALGLVLVVLVVAGAIIALRTGTNRSRFVLPAVLIGLLPMMALFPPLIFSADGRYGINAFVFIAIAIAITLARGLDAVATWCRAAAPARPTAPLPAVMPAVVLVAAVIWLAGYVMPEGRAWLTLRDAQPNAALIETVDILDRAGFEYIYGSYWSVLPVEFVADRRVTGGNFGGSEPVRFPERTRIVEARAPTEVAFVLQPNHDRPELWFLPADRYQRRVIGGSVVLIPLDGP